MTRSLNGRVAVVTGAGSGIGRAIALRLAEDTAKIAVWDINGEGAAETARLIEEAGGTAIAITADCAEKSAIHAAAAETRSRLGPVAILVNNAGIAPFTPFMDIDDDLFDKVIRINLRGPYLVVKEVLPDMLAAGWGRVINITSSSVQSGSFAQGHYVSSKGGLMGMTKALALEFAASGVTFNMVPPRIHRHPDAARRADRRRCFCPDPAHETHRQARGHRGRLRLSGVGGGQLYHRPDDQYQWRPLHGFPLTPAWKG